MASAGSPVVAHAANTNLPVQRTNLIGRETDIETIVGLLQESRLVTLTGAGGVGKTRAAIGAGEALLEDTKAGVWLVDLAPLRQGALVLSAVARALHVLESPNRPLVETLLGFLEQKALLLILDNCEHVIAEAAGLTDTLLRACPHLRILGACRSMPAARSKPPVPPNTSLLFGHNAAALLPHRAPRFDETFGSESVDVHTPTGS